MAVGASAGRKGGGWVRTYVGGWVRRSAVRRGAARRGAVLCGAAWCAVLWCGAAWRGAVWCVVVRWSAVGGTYVRRCGGGARVCRCGVFLAGWGVKIVGWCRMHFFCSAHLDRSLCTARLLSTSASSTIPTHPPTLLESYRWGCCAHAVGGHPGRRGVKVKGGSPPGTCRMCALVGSASS